VSADYFILQPDGTRDGPYAEEELLDLMDSGEIAAGTPCLHGPSGKVSEAGSLFRVLAPLSDKSGSVEWKPAPFRDEEEQSPEPATPDKSRVRLLYAGSPCLLSYWRSFLLAVVLIAGGAYAREKVPALLAAGLLSGMFVMLLAVLHRMKSRYVVTTARVECHRGLLFRTSRELRIADIRAINVTGAGAAGLPGIGRITFSSAAGPQEDITFDRVWRASSLKSLVRRLQDAPPSQDGHRGFPQIVV
jgi:hypothetical protein